MIKAGALYYAIFISFIIALLGLFVIMSVWTHHSETLIMLNNQRLERNIHSALLVAQETPSLFSIRNSIDLDLYNDGDEMVTLSQKLWGGYRIIKADAKGTYVRKSAIALFGKDVFVNEKTALYLSDNGQYLSVCGNTVINGDCFLPRSGIRNAFVEGNSFEGTVPEKELLHNSDQNLPEEDIETAATNISYLKGQISEGDSVGDIMKLTSDTIRHSFLKKTLVFYSDTWLNLTGKIIQGNIRIISAKGVTISKTVTTDNVIFYAPKIEIETGFTGNLQLFASDTIYINDGVRLLFPSLLAIPDTKNPNPLISIGAGSEIIGDLLLTSGNKNKTPESGINIKHGSRITGRVYCSDKIELRGTVNGTVYTKGFILRTTGSIYENHLLDATIDFKALPKYFSGSLINGHPERYKLIKWVH